MKNYAPNFVNLKEPFFERQSAKIHTYTKRKRKPEYTYFLNRKPEKDSIRQENYKLIPFMNMDVKILHYYLNLYHCYLHSTYYNYITLQLFVYFPSPLDFQPPQGQESFLIHLSIHSTQQSSWYTVGIQYIYVKPNFVRSKPFRLGAILEVFKICLRGSQNCTSVRQ